MKSILASKTVWLNTVMTLLGVFALLQQQSFSPQVLTYFVIGQGILNVILRVWFTSQPVS